MSSDEDQPGQSSPLLDKQTDESAELENSWERVDCYDDRNCKSIKNNFEIIDSEDDIDIESSLKRKYENVDIKSVKSTAKKSKVSPIKSEDEPDTNDNEDDESTDEYSEESENECDDNDLSSEDDENGAGEEDEQNKDDDDEEDEEEEDTEEIIPSADYDSDVSTDESERCPICLNRFLDQDVGTPESCDHNFCLECIQEWASNVNTCPVDRQVFHLILGRHSLDDIIFKKFPVDDRQAKDGDEDADETYCEICGRSDREDRLLLCDGCDLGYHCECLAPPLEHIPVEEWFCPECFQEQQGREEHPEESIEQEELTSLLDDSSDILLPPLRPLRTRAIARTRVSERVRARIRESRAQRDYIEHEEREESPQPSTSSHAQLATASSSTQVKVKSNTIKTRKIIKKRRTRKKKIKHRTFKRNKKTIGTKSGITKRRKRRRRKRKLKKIRVRPVRFHPLNTVKGRIADRLGLANPPKGRSIPLIKTYQDKTIENQRMEVGISALKIFGGKNDLDAVVESNSADAFSEPSPSTSKTSQSQPLKRGKIISKSALRSHQPVGKPLPRQRIITKLSSAPAASGDNFDILGSIIAEQSILLLKSENVLINRDGTLKPKISLSTSLSRPSSSSSISTSSSNQVTTNRAKVSSSDSLCTSSNNKCNELLSINRYKDMQSFIAHSDSNSQEQQPSSSESFINKNEESYNCNADIVTQSDTTEKPINQQKNDVHIDERNVVLSSDDTSDVASSNLLSNKEQTCDDKVTSAQSLINTSGSHSPAIEFSRDDGVTSAQDMSECSTPEMSDAYLQDYQNVIFAQEKANIEDVDDFQPSVSLNQSNNEFSDNDDNAKENFSEDIELVNKNLIDEENSQISHTVKLSLQIPLEKNSCCEDIRSHKRNNDVTLKTSIIEASIINEIIDFSNQDVHESKNNEENICTDGNQDSGPEEGEILSLDGDDHQRHIDLDDHRKKSWDSDRYTTRKPPQKKSKPIKIDRNFKAHFAVVSIDSDNSESQSSDERQSRLNISQISRVPKIKRTITNTLYYETLAAQELSRNAMGRTKAFSGSGHRPWKINRDKPFREESKKERPDKYRDENKYIKNDRSNRDTTKKRDVSLFFREAKMDIERRKILERTMLEKDKYKFYENERDKYREKDRGKDKDYYSNSEREREKLRNYDKSYRTEEKDKYKYSSHSKIMFGRKSKREIEIKEIRDRKEKERADKDRSKDRLFDKKYEETKHRSHKEKSSKDKRRDRHKSDSDNSDKIKRSKNDKYVESSQKLKKPVSSPVKTHHKKSKVVQKLFVPSGLIDDEQSEDSIEILPLPLPSEYSQNGSGDKAPLVINLADDDDNDDDDDDELGINKETASETPTDEANLSIENEKGKSPDSEENITNTDRCLENHENEIPDRVIVDQEISDLIIAESETADSDNMSRELIHNEIIGDEIVSDEEVIDDDDDDDLDIDIHEEIDTNGLDKSGTSPIEEPFTEPFELVDDEKEMSKDSESREADHDNETITAQEDRLISSPLTKSHVPKSPHTPESVSSDSEALYSPKPQDISLPPEEPPLKKPESPKEPPPPDAESVNLLTRLKNNTVYDPFEPTGSPSPPNSPRKMFSAPLPRPIDLPPMAPPLPVENRDNSNIVANQHSNYIPPPPYINNSNVNNAIINPMGYLPRNVPGIMGMNQTLPPLNWSMNSQNYMYNAPPRMFPRGGLLMTHVPPPAPYSGPPPPSDGLSQINNILNNQAQMAMMAQLRAPGPPANTSVPPPALPPNSALPPVSTHIPTQSPAPISTLAPSVPALVRTNAPVPPITPNHIPSHTHIRAPSLVATHGPAHGLVPSHPPPAINLNAPPPTHPMQHPPPVQHPPIQHPQAIQHPPPVQHPSHPPVTAHPPNLGPPPPVMTHPVVTHPTSVATIPPSHDPAPTPSPVHVPSPMNTPIVGHTPVSINKIENHLNFHSSAPVIRTGDLAPVIHHPVVATNSNSWQIATGKDVTEVVDMEVDPPDEGENNQSTMSATASSVLSFLAAALEMSKNAEAAKLGKNLNKRAEKALSLKAAVTSHKHQPPKEDKSKCKERSRHRHSVRFELPDKAKIAKSKEIVAKKKAEAEEMLIQMQSDEVPSSAVELSRREKFLKKLNRQERVIEEVKLALKPFYNKRDISKDEYKDVLRKCVPKICHNKSGEINPLKIKTLVQGYIKKLKFDRRRNPVDTANGLALSIISSSK